MEEMWDGSPSRDPLEEEMATTPVFLPGKNLMDGRPGVAKESDTA